MMSSATIMTTVGFCIEISRDSLDYPVYKPEEMTNEEFAKILAVFSHQWSDKRILISSSDSDEVESLPIPVRMRFGNENLIVNAGVDFDRAFETFMKKIDDAATKGYQMKINVGDHGFDYIW